MSQGLRLDNRAQSFFTQARVSPCQSDAQNTQARVSPMLITVRGRLIAVARRLTGAIATFGILHGARVGTGDALHLVAVAVELCKHFGNYFCKKSTKISLYYYIIILNYFLGFCLILQNYYLGFCHFSLNYLFG